MSELPYKPEHVNDEIANTEELTNEELGAYVRLQRALWRAGGYLPEEQLGRFSRSGKRWGAIGPIIMAKLTFGRGVASCPRVLDILFRTRDRRAKAALKASQASQARWAKSGSDGTASESSYRGMKAAKPLNPDESSMLEALVIASYGDANQNQNKNLDSKSLSAHRAAAGGQDEENVYRQAEKLLFERVQIRSLAARSQISKWLAAIGDGSELATILDAVAAENLSGPHLVRVINQRVEHVRRTRECGADLPFGFRPNVVAGGKS